MNRKDFKNKSEMQIFLSYFKPHRKLFFLDMACALGIAMIDLAFPFISRWCMYKLLPDNAWRTFWTVMAIVFCAYILRSVFTYIITYWGHTFGVRIETDFRRDLFQHIQELSYSYFDNARVGQLMSRLTSELFDITEFAHHAPEDIFISTVTIIGALIIMFTIQWKLALVIAVVAALVQFANIQGLKQIARFYIWIFRGTPLLVQLFVVFFGLSRVGIVLDPFPAAVIVFSLNEGAYCAETIRAALEAVPKGQLEAGLCAGLSYLQTIFRIVLPQAMRTAFPPLSNSLISMVKDTSLAANITVTEMFMVTQRIVARTYEPLLLYLEVGLIYLIFSTVLTKLQAVGEKKLGSYGQKGV